MAWAAWIALALAGCAAPIGAPEPDARRVTLISMNDLHSHAVAFPPIAGFAAAWRAAHPGEIVVLTDSGDWFSGTVYSVLGPHPASAAAPELEFFARQGIVSTLGNHEFDATPDGLWNMLSKARAAGYRHLVVSNLEVAAGSRFAGLVAETPERGSAGATVLHRRLLREYRSPDGTRRLLVGFVGILGPNAIEGSWSTRAGTGLRFVGWDDATRSVDWGALERVVGAQVRALRAEGAELVIALLHGGRPEDERIAKARLGIDVVAAGHTHAEYPPTRIGRTWLYQSGGEGHSVGRYTFVLDPDAGGLRYVDGGAVVVEDLRLDPDRLDASVLGGRRPGSPRSARRCGRGSWRAASTSTRCCSRSRARSPRSARWRASRPSGGTRTAASSRRPCSTSSGACSPTRRRRRSRSGATSTIPRARDLRPCRSAEWISS